MGLTKSTIADISYDRNVDVASPEAQMRESKAFQQGKMVVSVLLYLRWPLEFWRKRTKLSLFYRSSLYNRPEVYIYFVTLVNDINIWGIDHSICSLYIASV